MKFTYMIILCFIGFIALFLYPLDQEIPPLEGAAVLNIQCYKDEEGMQEQYASYNCSLYLEKKEEVERCGKRFAEIVKDSEISAQNSASIHLVYTEEDILIIFFGPHINSPIPYISSSLPSNFIFIGKEIMKLVDGLDENSISDPWVEKKMGKWVMCAKRITTNTSVSTQ